MHMIHPTHLSNLEGATSAAWSSCCQVLRLLTGKSVGDWQELLNHPFLRPSQSQSTVLPSDKSAGAVGLTKEQLRSLVAHVSAAGTNADLDSLSEQLFSQLAEGNGTRLGALLDTCTGACFSAGLQVL